MPQDCYIVEIMRDLDTGKTMALIYEDREEEPSRLVVIEHPERIRTLGDLVEALFMEDEELISSPE